jgi:hypothetical protein
VLETLRKYLRNLIIEIKYFEIHPTLKKKQFYLDVFGFFIMACFGTIYIFHVGLYSYTFRYSSYRNHRTQYNPRKTMELD